MKFDFAKHAPLVEKVQPTVEAPKTQEQFDAEIFAEAEKLGTNIRQLAAEIEQHGGAERFKVVYEKMVMEGRMDQNRAGREIELLSRRADRAKGEAEGNALLGSVLIGMAALGDFSVIQVGTSDFTGQFEAFVKQLSSDANVFSKGMAVSVAALISILFVSGGAMLIQSIKDGIKSRQLNRKKQREELKFKMTGTEVREAK